MNAFAVKGPDGEYCVISFFSSLGAVWADWLCSTSIQLREQFEHDGYKVVPVIVSEAGQAGMSAVSLINEYERQAKLLPCQHEISERGCSTYNWQMSAVRDLRELLSLAMEGENGAPVAAQADLRSEAAVGGALSSQTHSQECPAPEQQQSFDHPITQADQREAGEDKFKPCPACPDGNDWNSNGPTGRACKACDGHVVVNLDGSMLTKEQKRRLHS